MLDHVLDPLGRRRSRITHRQGDAKVQDHADDTDSFRRNAQQPVRRHVIAPGCTGPLEKQALEVLDVTVGSYNFV